MCGGRRTTLPGGDFERGDGTGGESIYPENPMGKFGDEPLGLQLRHVKKGLLTMSNSARNANGSQWIVTMKAIPVMDGKHVVFGQVESGMVRVSLSLSLSFDCFVYFNHASINVPALGLCLGLKTFSHSRRRVDAKSRANGCVV